MRRDRVAHRQRTETVSSTLVVARSFSILSEFRILIMRTSSTSFKRMRHASISGMSVPALHNECASVGQAQTCGWARDEGGGDGDDGMEAGMGP